jgi:hypothetical protein
VQVIPRQSHISHSREERITAIAHAIRRGAASTLHYRDLRLVMTAAGTTSSIDAVILGASLTEIEKRRDSRLVSAAFKALLASYRDEELRPILRRYCSRNFNMLRSNLRTFADRSGILMGNGELETLAQQLVQCKTIRSFLFEHELSSNILMSNYGL